MPLTVTLGRYGDLTPCESPLCRLLGITFIWTNVLVVPWRVLAQRERERGTSALLEVGERLRHLGDVEDQPIGRFVPRDISPHPGFQRCPNARRP